MLLLLEQVHFNVVRKTVRTPFDLAPQFELWCLELPSDLERYIAWKIH